MKQNLNIEAEGSELILKNKAGDYVIIPKKYRTEVQGMIKDNCYSCIDSLVETLPTMADYAQDGSLYPEEPPINPNNPIVLPEVVVTAEAPTYIKYRRNWAKENPFDIDKYVEDRFNNPIGREAIKRIDEKRWREYLRQEGLKKRQTELEEATKMGLLYQRFNPQGKDDIPIADEQFEKRYGTSPHRYRYDNDPKYREYYHNRAKNATSTIDYPSTDLRRKGVIAPNNMWMYPNLTGETQKAMTDFSNNVVGMALPIPGLEAMGKIPSVFKAGKNLVKNVDKVTDAIKPVSKVLNKTDDIANKLDELPIEIVFDDMLPNRNSTINLTRGNNYTKSKNKIPYEKIDLGNDLTLYNNASRQVADKDILGTNRAIKSVKNEKTNEYIDLKSWKAADGKLYYYMSANMPSSKVKAGRAYLELEKHIPKGESILENSSLSYDSFLNILKQTKNPKFESSVKGNINLNNMSIHNTVPFSEKKSSFTTTDRILFKTKEDANMSVIELNKLLKSNNLPEASVVEHHIKGSFLDVSETVVQDKLLKNKIRYGIELPNIALKKLYTILGLTSAGTYLQSQQNNKEE